MVQGRMDETPEPIAPPPSSVPTRRRRRRLWPKLLIGAVVIVVVVPVAAVGAFLLSFDPNAYKGQIESAAAQATGRQVTIAGPLALKFSLVPTITAHDVTVANLTGGSSPAMVQVGSIETRIALLPLLHHAIDIEALVLQHPTILLERTKDGTPNWVFKPTAPQPAAPQPAEPQQAAQPVKVEAGHSQWSVSLSRLDITDGTLTWHDLATGQNDSLTIKNARLATTGQADQPPEASPLSLSADTVWQGQAVTLKGSTGPVAALTGQAAATDWPIDLTLAAAGATLTMKGTVADPQHMLGYRLAVNGAIPALESVTPLLPPGLLPKDAHLPPVHGVALAATVTDAGQGKPAVTNLSLQAQNSDLGSLLPDLALDSLSVITPALDQPVTVNLLGQRNGLAFTLSGSTGPLTALMPPPVPAAAATPQPSSAAPAPAGLPVDLMLTAAQSSLHLQGSIADPLALRGLHLGLTAAIANLSTLGPLFGAQALPALVSLNGTAQLADGAQGLSQDFTLTALDLTAAQGDLEGAVSVDYAKRPTVLASLRSARLDLDGILNANPAAPRSAAPQPAPPATAAPAQAAPKPQGPRRVIPDVPLPVGLLHAFDGSAKFAFASLKLGGAEYRALVATATLENGVFSLAPSSVVVPGGQILAAGKIDAQTAVPHVTFAMQAQNLAVAPLLQALGLPTAARGLVQVFANLAADGATTRALAGSMTGAVGLAAVNGTIDGRALAQMLAPAVQAAGVVPSNLLNRAGEVPLYCLALRLNATQGQANVAAMLLDTSALQMQGTGTLDFGQERLALALTPELYIGEMDLTVPLTVGGSFADPQVGKVGKVVINQEAGNGAQGLNGLFQSIIGGGRKAARGVSPACAPALVLARNGQPGPDATAGGDAGLLQKPMNLFNKLLNGQ
ncbi:AsmA family protein [Acidisoma sp. 7E03]